MPESPSVTNSRVEFGAFTLDLQNGQLRKHGLRIKLQDQPFQVLRVLLEKPGDLVTRDELQRRLWPSDTYVEFDKGIYNAIKRLRETLSDDADDPRFIETVPRRGYRFIAALTSAVPCSPPARQFRYLAVLASSLFITVIAAFAWFLFPRRASSRLLSRNDAIVIADFENRTGDAIFDDTLKPALSAQVEQSPFFNVMSEDRVRETLRLMNRSSLNHIDNPTAREVCQRTASRVFLSGSIATLGSEYLLTLAATDCQSGNSLAHLESQASKKDDILKTLDKLSSQLRERLGESLLSIGQFSTPIEQATTPSLEALKAYTIGWRAQPEKGSLAAVPFFEQAIAIDPNFAMAYAGLGVSYVNLEEFSRAARYLRRAFELRNQVSQRERFLIEALYYEFVAGDLAKADNTYLLWEQTYPQDPLPPGNLGNDYISLGLYKQSIQESLQTLSFHTASQANVAYLNLMQAYTALGRFQDSRDSFEKAIRSGDNYPLLHGCVYYAAFASSDTTEMERQSAWAIGKPEIEDFLLSAQSDTAAYSGGLRQARRLSLEAIDSANGQHRSEAAALWQINSAFREAEFGYPDRARQLAGSVLAVAPGRQIQMLVALALARAGDVSRAESTANNLARDFPDDTLLQLYWLPAIRAAIALDRNNPSAAVEALRRSSPYDFASPPPFQLGTLYPAYLRGLAYLSSHQPAEAAGEFQKILDHPGIVLNFPLGALAHLGLARAYGLQGDVSRSRASYQTFLNLWKEADPTIPVLQAAKTEFARFR
jgi:eukaryotic-like serine/threonine-protein kinase